MWDQDGKVFVNLHKRARHGLGLHSVCWPSHDTQIGVLLQGLFVSCDNTLDVQILHACVLTITRLRLHPGSCL